MHSKSADQPGVVPLGANPFIGGYLSPDRRVAGPSGSMAESSGTYCRHARGGFTTTFAWSLILILKNGRAGEFAGRIIQKEQPVTACSLGAAAAEPATKLPLAANYFFAALAGTIWYFQFLCYSMGQTKMGKYDFSSWTPHMASIIIFSTLWGGLVQRVEWHTRRTTKLLVVLGLFGLIASTVVIGYGNYFRAASPAH
jgi:L-rhamnose-H+ transport protein